MAQRVRVFTHILLMLGTDTLSSFFSKRNLWIGLLCAESLLDRIRFREYNFFPKKERTMKTENAHISLLRWNCLNKCSRNIFRLIRKPRAVNMNFVSWFLDYLFTIYNTFFMETLIFHAQALIFLRSSNRLNFTIPINLDDNCSTFLV